MSDIRNDHGQQSEINLKALDRGTVPFHFDSASSISTRSSRRETRSERGLPRRHAQVLEESAISSRVAISLALDAPWGRRSVRDMSYNS
ncbi:hypothetical protein MRX96_014693 [Rhipicephalus microplus]